MHCVHDEIVGKTDKAEMRDIHINVPCSSKRKKKKKRQNLDSSKPKDFADGNSKFNGNGRKFSKWIENTMGKGERAISHFSTMLFTPADNCIPFCPYLCYHIFICC